MDDVNEVVDAYELSPLQQGMLFHALSAPETGVDIQQVIVTLDEPVNVAALEGALWDVMRRHPILRTRFRWLDVEEPCQEVLARAPQRALLPPPVVERASSLWHWDYR